MTGSQTWHLHIRGIVQGVGFRPFVYRLAHEHGIGGWVKNTSSGVEIAASGSPEVLERLLRDLVDRAPPLARIESVTVTDKQPGDAFADFAILASTEEQGAYQLISPDIATCADCLREILDPRDRRYRYPFTNCTNCGPRFTIIQEIPYDRPRTTMRDFAMCSDCQREYDDPLDRRFHAQPNACPRCGPHLTLVDPEGRVLGERDQALTRAVAALREGRIVAIKGLGGYQLACDATNAQAVRTLRQRKRRPHKPFALMVKDLDTARAHALIGPEAAELMRSPSAPIVLVPRRADSPIVDEVAPRISDLGLMLPYTPLHHLLLRDIDRPLVMTSGNLTEEPIARDNDEALGRLKDIADLFLTHDRGIYSRYDDSVWFLPASGAQPIRRARGYAPFPITLPVRTRPILACGAELKNTFCLTRDQYAFVSQHIGDMQNAETIAHYQETLALYRRLFHIDPEIIACDLHPDYYTTRLAHELTTAPIGIQHHHAHLAACLVDAGHSGPAIGLIMDGTGYGLDGHTWGGEILIGDARGFARAAHLQYLPLPGGDQAVRKPYRLAYAYLRQLLPDRPLPATLEHIPEGERRILDQMIAQGINTPWTSSAGRLFDAVAALLGVRQEVSYEAQAAIELEMQARTIHAPVAAYRWTWQATEVRDLWGHPPVPLQTGREILLTPLLADIVDDLNAGEPIALIARRFHETLATLLLESSLWLAHETSIDVVALSGGCFQNRLLADLLVPRLESSGLKVLLHRQVPCNDGGLSLGQAIIAHYATEESF